jgi:hypothetical protein
MVKEPGILADDERAMVELGVGKNMVRSIRFWVEVMNVAIGHGSGILEPTAFAHAVFADDGFDPYLEDSRTLWLLHWHLATHSDDPVFAWRYLLNHWTHPELTRSEVLIAFKRESENAGFSHSEVTLAQHFDVFLHTYVTTRSTATAEDSIDGPLVDLALLQYVGDRRVGGTGRREPVYAFRREAKPEITEGIFEYCLHDFWQQWRPSEATLTLRDVALAPCSLGQVFKLPEDEVRERLERFVRPTTPAPFSYSSSAVQGLVSRAPNCPTETIDLLPAVYAAQVPHV